MAINMKKRALKYAARGYAVVPMYSTKAGQCACSDGKNCHRPGKHPMTNHGVNDATTNRNQIRSWWTEHPYANIGIAVGSKSGPALTDNRTMTWLRREFRVWRA